MMGLAMLSSLSEQFEDTDGDQEPFNTRVELNEEVGNTDEEKRKEDEHWQLCHLLSQEVNVSPVHAIVVLPQEKRQFYTEHIDNCEDIGKSQVSDEEEENTIDIDNTILVDFLAKVDDANEDSFEDGLQHSHLHYLWLSHHS